MSKSKSRRDRSRTSVVAAKNRPEVSPSSQNAVRPNLLMRGVQHLQAQQLREAEQCFRETLATESSNHVAYNCLGIVLANTQRITEAMGCFQRALGLKPGFAEALCNLGNALRALGQTDDATNQYLAAIKAKPTLAEAHNGLGTILLSLGHYDDAKICFEKALQHNPQLVEAINNLGNVLREQGQPQLAVPLFQEALRLTPTLPEIHNNLGNALRDQGWIGEAVACYERAIQLHANFAEAHNNLGSCRLLQGDAETAVSCFQEAVRLKPDSAEFLLNYGQTLKQQERLNEASTVWNELARVQPNEPLHTLRTGNACPAVFDNSTEMESARLRLRTAWESFGRSSQTISLAKLPELVSEPPFNLQFFSDNVRPWKEAYSRLFEERLPQLPLVRNHGRPRVGFVVTRGHEGIFLKSMAGVLRQLSSAECDWVVFAPRPNADRVKAGIAATEVEVRPLPARFDQIAETVQSAACDVLYYWEIGTDATNYFLPFLRLAPVQCTSWGVQVTSGIRNVDYYLSSQLVEPAASDLSDGDPRGHYSETLLLADTLLTYQTASAPPAPFRPRASFGVDHHQHLYACPQQLGKFHPDFDPLLRDILLHDPLGVLVLTMPNHSDGAETLRTRLTRTLDAAAARVVFLPRLSTNDYLSLIAAADVLLDPLHFGGVNSTYDTLGLGKAVVTLPSKFHRGRYTFGCYQKLGMTDCVASSPSDYVRIAVKLGTDAAWRREVETQITSRQSQLFEDRTAILEHERLFTKLIQVARGN